MSAIRSLLLALTLMLVPCSAMAHPAFGGAGGFYGGLLHPLLVPAHLMAIVAIAALAALQQPQWHWAGHWHAPVLYALGLALGSFAIAGAFAPTYADEAVLICAAMSALSIVLGVPLPTMIVAILSAATGIAIAADSPPDALAIREAIVAQIGTFCGAILMYAVVIELVSLRRYPWQRVGLRIVGSWIAASALLVLALQLAK